VRKITLHGRKVVGGYAEGEALLIYMLYFKFSDTLPVTREEIADTAGTTSETRIRVLGQLRNLGIIDSRRGRITVLNKTKLRDVSRCSYLIFPGDD
jgi:CRP-like cAMP-binding protein